MTEENKPQTVANFEFAKIPAQLRMEDLVGMDVAIMVTGNTMISEDFPDLETGEPREGWFVHMVARDPKTKTILFSDPAFPTVLWQKVVLRIVARAYKVNNWTAFTVTLGRAKNGRKPPYIPAPIMDDERDAELYAAVAEYMIREVGLEPADEISLLVDNPYDGSQALPGTPAREIEARPDIVDGELV